MAKGVAIGLTELYYAVLQTDPVGGTPVYGAPQRIPGVITANFSPNASNDTLFADDGPYETASTLGAMTLELNVADIPAADRAILLGQTYENGILSASSEDIPPYVAVGMSVMKSNGFKRLIWYLKGKFTAPDDNNQTKADSINWNTPTISGNFLKRDADNEWRYSVDTDDVNVATTVVDGWFDSPNVKDNAPATTNVFTLTQTGIGDVTVNGILYTAPRNFGFGEVVIIRFPAGPSAFSVDATSELANIVNGVYAFVMPDDDVAAAVTFD